MNLPSIQCWLTNLHLCLHVWNFLVVNYSSVMRFLLLHSIHGVYSHLISAFWTVCQILYMGVEETLNWNRIRSTMYSVMMLIMWSTLRSQIVLRWNDEYCKTMSNQSPTSLFSPSSRSNWDNVLFLPSISCHVPTCALGHVAMICYLMYHFLSNSKAHRQHHLIYTSALSHRFW